MLLHRSSTFVAASAMLILFSGGPIAAQDVGINGGSCSFFTIQDAIDDFGTQDGDVIYVDAGTHFPAATLAIDKDLTFVAAENGCTTEAARGVGGVAVASISGSNLHAVAAVEVGRVVFFRNLDLIDGEDFQGGILHVESGAWVYLEDVRLTGGLATNDGGCLYVDNAVVYLEDDSIVYDCQANLDGGGVALRNSAALYVAESRIGSYMLSGNTALRNGGGVHLSGGTLELSAGSYIALNEALGAAGAGALQGYGGGVYAEGGAAVVIEGNSSISDNEALSLWGSGGGVYLVGQQSENTTLILQDSAIVVGNMAERGGGVAVLGSATAYLRGLSQLQLNEALQGQAAGGGFYVGAPEGSGAFLVMEDESMVWINRAGWGGGVYLDGGSLVMTGASAVGCADCFFGAGLGNFATETGGGIYAEPYGSTRPSLVLEGEPWLLDPNGWDVTGGVQIAYNWTDNSSGTPTEGGGGMALRQTDVWTSFVVIEGNEARSFDAASGGGGHLSDDSVFDGVNTLINANDASADGGGFYVEDSRLELRTDTDSCDPLSLGAPNRYCSEVRGNMADGNGAALAVKGSSEVDIRKTGVMYNGWLVDATLLFDGTSAGWLRNVLLAENGGDLSVDVGSSSGLFVDSATFADQGSSVRYRSGAGGYVKNSIFWDQAAGGGPGLEVDGVLEGHCNLGMGVGVLIGVENDDGTDPLFVTDPLRGDYRLDPASPAAGACDSGPGRDLDGLTRPLPVSTGFDRGAFEVDQ